MTKRRKIPTKAELIRLQKLYKTDEKIGERLGGVPAYLVAYWRRKKNVARHSAPKFSEREIKSLWERFGDDDRCGLELGISKAAYYNWRRRYGIREKPAFLKLEQLELNFPGMKLQSHSPSLWNKQTVSQKVLARVAAKEKVETGEQIEVEPDYVLVTGNIGQIIEKFHKHKIEHVWNSGRIILTPDECVNIPAGGKSPARTSVQEFVKRQRLRYFYDAPEGDGHQLAVEQGHILPGQLTVGTGSAVASIGCLVGLGRVVNSDIITTTMATGKVQLEVPESIRIDISGRKSRGVYARDIALSIIKRLTAEGASNKVIEYYGHTVSQMSISERFTLCNLSSFMAAISAVCPFDATTRRYLAGRTSDTFSPVMADKNAVYSDMYQINIDQLLPQVACPDNPGAIKDVAEVETLPVNLIILGAGTNGRLDDLRIAANILKGKKIHSECRLLIIPASRTVYLEALRKGLIRIFSEAGAIVMPPGFCTCTG
ncbi:MAG: aconitase family protein, partial [candidate division Zixibacteria bacterium]|nr:aconitase family protein [candidate division Zixibacteria bacterium]